MLTIFSTVLLSFIAAETPTTWLDARVDEEDRAALEQLVHYSLPQIPESATWILEDEEEEAPTWDQFRGKVVIVQSWTSATAGGRLAVGAAVKAVTKSDSPLEVVLVTIHTPQGLEKIDKFLQKKSAGSYVIADTTGEICNSLGFYKYPTNIVIGRNGVVRHVGLRIKGLIEAVDALLEEPFDPKFEATQFEPPKALAETKMKYPAHSSSYGRATDMQGKKAPTFVVEQWLSDEYDVAGKVHIVEFWATWCPPCRKSIPHLNDLAAQFKDEVVVVGVTNEPSLKVHEFMQKTPMKYGVAIDTKRRMQDAVKCKAIPMAMVISSDGIVRWQGNPIGLTEHIVQQVLSADRGETTFLNRGRWNAIEDDG